MVERSSAYVLQPREGRVIDLGNFVMSLKADGSGTSGLFSAVEAAEPADFGPPMHIHRNAAEAFYVLDGLYRMFIQDKTWECAAGSFVFVPPGVEHSFRVGPLPSRKLNLYAPAAMVGYFDDLSAAIKSGDIGDQRLADIALEYGMEITGPVPEGYL
jgi:mannose-6-phosphate isomerase-like protein (cupin superfamily)